MYAMNIVCPICGRHSPESTFTQNNQITDIIGVDVRGLGRGKGFEVTGRYSLLGEPSITGIIEERCNRTLLLIQGNGFNSHQDFLSLQKNRDDWIKYAKSLENEKQRLDQRISELAEAEAYLEEMEGYLDKICEAASYPFEDLPEAIDYLLEVI